MLIIWTSLSWHKFHYYATLCNFLLCLLCLLCYSCRMMLTTNSCKVNNTRILSYYVIKQASHGNKLIRTNTSTSLCTVESRTREILLKIMNTHNKIRTRNNRSKLMNWKRSIKLIQTISVLYQVIDQGTGLLRLLSFCFVWWCLCRLVDMLFIT